MIPQVNVAEGPSLYRWFKDYYYTFDDYEDFKDKYSIFFSGVDIRSKAARFMFIFYVLRYWCLNVFLIFLNAYPNVQIFLILALNFLFLFYNIRFRPFKSRISNGFNILSEAVLVTCSIILVLLFYQNPAEYKAKLEAAFIYLSQSLNIIIFFNIVHKIWNRLKKPAKI